MGLDMSSEMSIMNLGRRLESFLNSLAEQRGLGANVAALGICVRQEELKDRQRFYPSASYTTKEADGQRRQ